MVISYAAVRNHHAKITMPSIENGWYTSSNIQKDPPKSIKTRRIDKVGDTMATNIMIAESPDRQCEAINYYARGVNPMVSVNYGQGQAGTQAYLPHTVARDGAFRPPVLYGVTNLLPLSRLPRILTNVCATPYQPIFTKRIRDCGTCDQTKEVKNDMLRTSCIAQKAIQSDPDINIPVTALQIRNDVMYQNVKTTPSCPTNAEEIRLRLHQKQPCLPQNRPSGSATTNNSTSTQNTVHTLLEKYDNFYLSPNKPNTNAQTNYSLNRESTEMFNNIHLEQPLSSNKPATEAYTNFSMNKETPVVFDNVHLEETRPYTSATTSLTAPGTNAIQSVEYRRLQPRPGLGGFDGYKQIPKMLENPVKRLTR